MPENKVRLPRILNINQAIKRLRVVPTTLRRWGNNGKLKTIRIGNKAGIGERQYRREDTLN